MLYYSYSALKYALDRCFEKPQYKVGIVPLNMKSTIEDLIILMHKKEYEQFQDSMVWYQNKNHFYVHFTNGSMIECLPATENARSRAYHLIIVDEKVNDDVLCQVLRPMEKLETIERYNRSLRKE